MRAKADRVQYHQTSFTTNAKGTSQGGKHKRRKRPTKNKPKTIKKIVIGTCACVVSCSVTKSPTLCHPMDCSHQPPLFMGFSRQGYWSGQPFPPQGDLSNPGIKPTSPVLQEGSFTAEPHGKPNRSVNIHKHLNINRLRAPLVIKGTTCQCRRHEFDPRVRKIPFLLGKSCGQRRLVGYSPLGHKRVRHDLATKRQKIDQMLQPKDIDQLNGYKNKPLYMLSTRDPPQIQGHTQTENKMEKYSVQIEI